MADDTQPSVLNGAPAPTDISALTGTQPPGAPTLAGPQSPDMGPEAGAPGAPVPGVAGASISSDQVAPPKPAGTPSVWKNLLMGALIGLTGTTDTVAGSVAGGMRAGINYQEQQKKDAMAAQEQNAKIRFQSLQAAHMTAEDALLAKQVENYDSDHQQQVFGANMDRAKTLQDMGFTPIVTNSDGERMAQMESQTKTGGGVPPHISLQVGPDQYLSFTLDASNAGNMYSAVKDHFSRLGQPVPDPATWSKLSATQKIKLMEEASESWLPSGDPKQLAKQESDLATIQKLPDTTPNKQDSIDTLTKAIATSKELVASTQQTKAEGVAASALARFKAVPHFQRVTIKAPDGSDQIVDFDPNTKRVEPIGMAPDQWYQVYAKTKTIQKLGDDSLPHIYSLNLQTGQFDIDQGVSVSGAYGHEMLQAGAVGRAAMPLIYTIQANKDKFGDIQSILNSAFLGTPLSDPASQELASQIKSFAALNPSMHGFRGTNALNEFEKLLGGLPNNPDALVQGILGIVKTAGAINPALKTGTTAQPQARPVFDKSGKLIGHTTDGKTMIPVSQ